MTDRELLELAAKATGMRLLHIEVYPNGFTEAVREGFNPDGGNIWNPLINDGDALRLAVKLNMTLWIFPGDDARAEAVSDGQSNFVDEAVRHHDADPYAATRRAIVRAAAEIGRNMP